MKKSQTLLAQKQISGKVWACLFFTFFSPRLCFSAIVIASSHTSTAFHYNNEIPRGKCLSTQCHLKNLIYELIHHEKAQMKSLEFVTFLHQFWGENLQVLWNSVEFCWGRLDGGLHFWKNMTQEAKGWRILTRKFQDMTGFNQIVFTTHLDTLGSNYTAITFFKLYRIHIIVYNSYNYIKKSSRLLWLVHVTINSYYITHKTFSTVVQTTNSGLKMRIPWNQVGYILVKL